ncbi:gamma carbonic anhydrase family protein [Terrarubrum flagellatum]|uniref:gamma carbonic anhydrase family protein n=1 Tax=Terrirubrum flagellatum TaxID=2895980 RepID=UPI003144E4CB
MPLYSLDGHAPEIADPARFYLAPDAHVIGRVRIGLDVSVWFGAVVRGDNDLIIIGDETNIQDGCVLHVDPGVPLTLGRNVTVGHKAILHGCVIGDGALIGMGATVLDGARIGAGSLVGAGALVTEGKEFPERSLIVGSPAKAIRQLDDAAVANVARLSDNYVRNGKRFRAGLKLIGD